MKWDRVLFGIALVEWARALGVTALFLVVLRIVKVFLDRHAKKLVATPGPTGSYLDAVLRRTRFSLLTIVALAAGAVTLRFTGRVMPYVQALVTVVLLVQFALWLDGVISLAIRRYHERKGGDAGADELATRTIVFLVRLALYSCVVLMALDNIPGVHVGALITGLGVGGIAVALAAQKILGDLFASVSITLDKPFEIGDFIVIGDSMGTVEHVGLKTTRIRSLSGEQVVVSNQDLLASRIRNYKRMRERRVAFSLGVTYRTTPAKMEVAVGVIRAVIESADGTRFDRCHWKSYGPSSLDIETVYYVLDSDYNRFMDIQHRINLEIYRRFEAEGIEFAYPTQTLFVHRPDARATP